ncbi:MAG TPA: phosphoribosylformylglycinamidine synthase subunit PurS [Acidimicrobiia bacterium]|jgi:phosphoribosylformylglycinamidine synthase
MTKYRIDIRRKHGLADPEGATTARALHDLGYSGVVDVSFGRVIFVDTDDGDASDVAAMCEQLLANPVIEEYAIEVVE